MGVADGHGVHGHLVSNFVKMNLPKILSDMIQNKQPSPIDNYGISPVKKNKKSFLPTIGSRKKYEIDGENIQSENEAANRNDNLISEHWLTNDNHKIRDYQIKDSFKKVEGKHI